MSTGDKTSFAKVKRSQVRLTLIDNTKKSKKKPFKKVYEKQKKLDQLLEHYEISSSDNRHWLKLAICLAEEYVPGFNARPQRVTWTNELIRQLLKDHSRYRKQLSFETDEEIFAYMITVSPWKERNITARTLHNRFCRVKRPRRK